MIQNSMMKSGMYFLNTLYIEYSAIFSFQFVIIFNMLHVLFFKHVLLYIYILFFVIYSKICIFVQSYAE